MNDASVPLIADHESLKGVDDAGSPDRHAARYLRSDPVRSASLEEIYQIEDRSLYDRKCMIVNREIERLGMGRYQWCIWGLCGLGYFIDLLWAQAFGLVVKPMQQEFGFGCAYTPPTSHSGRMVGLQGLNPNSGC